MTELIFASDTPAHGDAHGRRRWYVKSENRAMQFLCFTYPGDEKKWGEEPFHYTKWQGLYLMPADVGHHQAYPDPEKELSEFDGCDILKTERCYYDGSGLMADHFLRLWAAEDFDEEFIRQSLTLAYYELWPTPDLGVTPTK